MTPEERKAKRAEYMRQYYRRKPDYRESLLAREATKRKSPEHQAKEKERHARRSTNLEHREREKQRTKRRAEDPHYREQAKIRAKKRYRQQRLDAEMERYLEWLMRDDDGVYWGPAVT